MSAERVERSPNYNSSNLLGSKERGVAPADRSPSDAVGGDYSSAPPTAMNGLSKEECPGMDSAWSSPNIPAKGKGLRVPLTFDPMEIANLAVRDDLVSASSRSKQTPRAPFHPEFERKTLPRVHCSLRGASARRALPLSRAVTSSLSNDDEFLTTAASGLVRAQFPQRSKAQIVIFSCALS